MTPDKKRWVKAADHARTAIDALAHGEGRLTDAAMSLENALTQVYEAQKDIRVRARAAEVIHTQTNLGLPESQALYDRVMLAAAEERERS